MQRFTIPRDIYFGSDALNFFKNLDAKKVFIVIGSKRLIEDKTIDKIKSNLKTKEIEIFTGIKNDPEISIVLEGAKKMQEFNPDAIIAIGGGSPIDAAKAMWIYYEYPDIDFNDVIKPFELPQLRKKAKFYAVPTTSGTATEVTSFSVIAKDNIKYPIADYNITPDVAIIDTSLTASMPKSLVANTGMDALTHAIEAYVSKLKNPITDALAIKSIEMIGKNLINSYNEDQKARENMHIAQSLAGMAFSNAILGIVHSIAHKSGKIFNIAHGMANALYLTYVIEFNSKVIKDEFIQIANALKINTNSNKVEALVTYIKDLRTKLNLPHSLKEFGVDEEFYKSIRSSLAKNAVEDPCTSTNPREISVDEMEKLLDAIYYGNKVEF